MESSESRFDGKKESENSLRMTLEILCGIDTLKSESKGQIRAAFHNGKEISFLITKEFTIYLSLEFHNVIEDQKNIDEEDGMLQGRLVRQEKSDGVSTYAKLLPISEPLGLLRRGPYFDEGFAGSLPQHEYAEIVWGIIRRKIEAFFAEEEVAPSTDGE